MSTTGESMRHIHELERTFMTGQSNLEVICGPMFSGKTEELIRRIRRVEYARKLAVVFKPQIDKRYSEDLVVSHSSQKIESVPVRDVADIRDCLGAFARTPHAVGLDEVHFFSDDVISLCEDLVSAGIRVIAAGLCEDYLCKPFGPMPGLLSNADVVTKLWAVCMRCGLPASKTQRIKRPGQAVGRDQVLVGAGLLYEARCRSCHQKDVAELDEGEESHVEIGRSPAENFSSRA